MQDYQQRLTERENQVTARQPDYWDRRERQALSAQRAALAAEKSALQEAGKQGWLREEDRRGIVARIDAELLALETKR